MRKRSEEKRTIDRAITDHVRDHAAVLSCPSRCGVEELTDRIVALVRHGKVMEAGR